jgi:hypothetical protein
MTNTKVPIFSLLDLQNGRHRDEFCKCLEKMGIFYLRDYSVPEAEHQLARNDRALLRVRQRGRKSVCN